MISIRRASPEEADQLTHITVTSKRHWGYPEHWIQQWLPELTFSSSYILEHEVWLAVVDETLAGYYSFKLQPVIARARLYSARSNPQYGEGLLRREVHPPRNDGDELWLENLWILPEYMGQGIGRQLIAHALEQSRIHGVSFLKIEADPNAQSFYERMGAHKIGEHQYEMDGHLRILPVMEINISPRT